MGYALLDPHKLRFAKPQLLANATGIGVEVGRNEQNVLPGRCGSIDMAIYPFDRPELRHDA
jgi:hypothetical protein